MISQIRFTNFILLINYIGFTGLNFTALKLLSNPNIKSNPPPKQSAIQIIKSIYFYTYYNNVMRKLEFIVPAEVIDDFVEKMIDHQLNNQITGINSDGEIIIEITYERDDEESVNELEDYLDDIKEETNNE